MRLVVDEWGNPTGPEPLLILGIAPCHFCFAPQIARRLVRGLRIVAYDRHGHEASQQPVDPMAYQAPRVLAKPRRRLWGRGADRFCGASWMVFSRRPFIARAVFLLCPDVPFPQSDDRRVAVFGHGLIAKSFAVLTDPAYPFHSFARIYYYQCSPPSSHPAYP